MKVMRPAVPDGFARRPYLDELLDAGTKRRLTLVSAGPGWGKTLAVAAWAERVDRPGPDGERGTPVGWLTLDEDDNSPSAFWHGVLAALRSTGALPADNPLSTVSVGPRLTADVLGQLHRGLVDLTSPVVLVIDDFHVVDDQDVLDAVAAMVRMDLSLSLVLVTRHDPVLPLHRLRVDGDLGEIRAAQLSFDADDAAALLRRAGKPLPEGDVRRLVEHTEGWAVGLRLAALWLAENPDATTVEQFEGDVHAVAEYLLVEVLDAQKPDARDFMLRTSVVPRISSGLAEELVDVLPDGGSARSYLQDLVRDNMFITALGPGNEWFRYHPLLREMLAAVLAAERPELVPALHSTAARWFSRHGEPLDALRHAAAAQDWPLVGSTFVSDCALLILGTARETVDGILAQVPDSATAGSPTLQLAAAARALNANRLDDMVQHTSEAERLMDRCAAADRLPATVTLYALQGAAFRVRGDMTGLLGVTGRTLDLLAVQGSALLYGELFRAVALNSRAVGLMWTGRLDEARDTLAEAWPVVERAGLVVTHVNVLGHLALIAFCQGRLGEAEDYAERGLALARRHGAQTLVQTATSYLALGVVQLARGRAAEAEHTLHQALLAPRTELEPPVVLATHVAGALAAAARGRPESARRAAGLAEQVAHRFTPPPELARWLTGALVQARLSSGDAAGSLTVLHRRAARPSGQERLWWALVELALGRVGHAEDVLAPLRRRADRRRDALAVGARVVAALVEDRRRRGPAAREEMRAALAAAERQRIALPFLLDAPRAVPLLRLVEAGPEAESAFARDVLEVVSGLGQASAEEPTPLVETLTDRELTVLRHLPSMRSNAEISTEMFVSVNTVKAHLKALYRKLDVDSRRHAVVRGQDLGLIT